jgi:hypothetical protein
MYQELGMNVGTVFLVIVILQIIRKTQRIAALEIDNAETTPQDYALKMSGFPKSAG